MTKEFKPGQPASCGRLSEEIFEKVVPTDDQALLMDSFRREFESLLFAIDLDIPDGVDKDHAIRLVREAAMWVNVCILKDENGNPLIK